MSGIIALIAVVVCLMAHRLQHHILTRSGVNTFLERNMLASWSPTRNTPLPSGTFLRKLMVAFIADDFTRRTSEAGHGMYVTAPHAKRAIV